MDRASPIGMQPNLIESPKYSVSWIAKRLKRRSKQTLLEKAFTEKRFAVIDSSSLRSGARAISGLIRRAGMEE